MCPFHASTFHHTDDVTQHCHHTLPRKAATMNSAATLMTSHNTATTHSTPRGRNHELCHHTDDVTQHCHHTLYPARPQTSVDLAGDDGQTPLHSASLHYSDEMVRTLLRRGANVHATIESTGATPLMMAAKSGWDSIVRFFFFPCYIMDSATDPRLLSCYCTVPHYSLHCTVLLFPIGSCTRGCH
jgi:hypothetical protein